MDLLNVVIRADTSGADRSTAALDKMTAGAHRADAAIKSLGHGGTAGLAQFTRAADEAAAAQQRLAAASRMSIHRTAGLATQLADVGQMLALGQAPMMTALQQGPQIFSMYGNSLSGLGQAFKDMGGLALGAARALMGPFGLGLAAVVAGIAGMTHEIDQSTKVSVGFGDTFMAIGQTLWDTFANFISPVTRALAEMFSAAWGVVVTVTKATMNYLINSVVGAVKTIGAVWNGLPAALGEIGIVMANTIVTAFEGAINKAGDMLNAFIAMANQVLPGIAIGTIGKVELPKFSNPLEGSKDRLGANIGAIANENVDYMGGFFDDVRGRAIQNAIDGNKDAAKAAKDAAKELERQAEAYTDLTRGAHQFIEAEQLKARSLGMTEEAAARMKFTQDLLNKAANDNIDLTAGQRQEIDMLGAAMAAAQEATRRITEIYEFGKGVFGSFFSNLRSGISEGKSLWESLANAASNALDSIANKMMEQAANGLWDMLFGAVMGGITGSMGGNSLGGGWGTAGGFGKPGIFGIPGMADGGTVGRAGLSWVGERGPELLRLPAAAQIIPNGPSMAMAANGNGGGDFNIHNHMQIMPGATEEDGAAFARGFTREMKRQGPNFFKQWQKNDLRRAS